MPPVREEDMIRLLVDPLPMNLLAFLMNLPDFLFFGVLGERIFVALQTDGHFRHAGKRLVLKMGMAGDTFDSLFLVFFVVEGERLFGFGTEAEEDNKQYNTSAQPDEEGFHSSLLSIGRFPP
jgi:hypothetical protein